jgi:hypothetical protein
LKWTPYHMGNWVSTTRTSSSNGGSGLDASGTSPAFAISNWMGNCADKIGPVLLKDLRIPGTHDSFTNAIDAPFVSNWMITQSTSVAQQLVLGVRYFDCRVRAASGNYWTYHGLCSSQFMPILQAVKSFIEVPANAREIIILDMSHFQDFCTNDAPCLRQMVSDLFQEKLVPPTIDLSTTTVNDIWATTGRILALFDAPNYPGLVLTDASSGEGPDPMDVGFIYTIDSKYYFQGFHTESKKWSIAEILENGVLDTQTANGQWEHSYAVQFPFVIGGQQYFMACDPDSKTWKIQQLLAGGKMGQSTDSGAWANSYPVQFAFAIDNRQFFMAFNPTTKYWFIQELLEGGKMGTETAHGTLPENYSVQFPFTIGGSYYFLGYSLDQYKWTIRELLPGGLMGDETDSGQWQNPYAVQYPISFAGRQFFVSLNTTNNYWFLEELLPGGKMGDEILDGFLPSSYAMVVSAASLPTPFLVHQEGTQWRTRVVRVADAPNIWGADHRSQMFRSYWPNQGDLTALITANTQILEIIAPFDAANRLFVLQCQITPPETTFLEWLIAHDCESLRQFATQVNAYYAPWLTTVDPTTTRINIVIADFVDEEYCRAVIAPYLPLEELVMSF